MEKVKSAELRKIRKEIQEVFENLEYQHSLNYKASSLRTSHLDIEIAECFLNAIKSLEYLFRDDVPEMRAKKNWSVSLKNAHRILKKYSESSDEGNIYSNLQLKSKFDSSGWLEHRDYMKDMVETTKTKKTSAKRTRV